MLFLFVVIVESKSNIRKKSICLGKVLTRSRLNTQVTFNRNMCTKCSSQKFAFNDFRFFFQKELFTLSAKEKLKSTNFHFYIRLRLYFVFLVV